MSKIANLKAQKIVKKAFEKNGKIDPMKMFMKLKKHFEDEEHIKELSTKKCIVADAIKERYKTQKNLDLLSLLEEPKKKLTKKYTFKSEKAENFFTFLIKEFNQQSKKLMKKGDFSYPFSIIAAINEYDLTSDEKNECFAAFDKYEERRIEKAKIKDEKLKKLLNQKS
jgi:hypothetical protein